jgi:hypothetical protein
MSDQVSKRPRSKQEGSMWQERYWNKLCEVRTHTFYYQEYLNDSRKKSGWLKAFLAVVSSGSIAGWAVWQEYQFVWGGIIALSQVVNAVKRFLPFEKRISVLGIVYSRLTALAVSVENDWYDVSEGRWSSKEINRKITEIKQDENAIYDELNTVYVPDKKGFLNIAEEKADQYLKYHFNN